MSDTSAKSSKKGNSGGKIRKEGVTVEVLGSRVPPHSTDAEMAVLGSMIIDGMAISKVLEFLSIDAFYHEKHRRIFETIISLFQKKIEVDILTLGEELYNRDLLDDIGGSYYLAQISDRTPSASNVEYYARIVQEKYLKRRMIGEAGRIMENCFDDSSDVLDEIDRAEGEIFKIAEKRISISYNYIKKYTDETVEIIEKLLARDHQHLSGVPSGYLKLDDLLGGFQNSDFIVIAGRPSMGKTALALSIARNIAVDYKMPLAFFSIEMSAVQLVIRLIAAESRLNAFDIRTGKISRSDFNKKIMRALDVIAYSPIIIDSSPRLSVMELRAKCRRLKVENGIRAVFIDYLQLMQSPKAESREREISIISQSLKQIAKELDIPVIAMAQLNRSVESRADKRPLLSDLRESGSIEQDSDVVMFVNRPEYYGIKTYDDKMPTENTAEVIIGKQRNGPIGDLRLTFLKNFARFENMAENYDDMPSSGYEGDEDEPKF